MRVAWLIYPLMWLPASAMGGDLEDRLQRLDYDSQAQQIQLDDIARSQRQAAEMEDRRSQQADTDRMFEDSLASRRRTAPFPPAWPFAK